MRNAKKRCFAFAKSDFESAQRMKKKHTVVMTVGDLMIVTVSRDQNHDS